MFKASLVYCADANLSIYRSAPYQYPIELPSCHWVKGQEHPGQVCETGENKIQYSRYELNSNNTPNPLNFALNASGQPDEVS